MAELRAQYPDAAPWYGPESGLWLAAPSGAVDGLIQAPTAAALAAMLADHYRRLISQTLRSVRPEQHRPAGGTSGTMARQTDSHSAASRTTASSGPTPGPTRPDAMVRLMSPRPAASCVTVPPKPHAARHEVSKVGWFRRGLVRSGLVAVTA